MLSRTAIVVSAVLLLAGVGCVPATSGAQPAPPQPPFSASETVTTVVPVQQDTYLSAAEPTRAKGNTWWIESGDAGGETVSLLRFTVSGIPEGACQVTASLRLWSRSSTPTSSITTVYRLDPDDWDERTVNWSTLPKAGPVLATARGLPAREWVRFDVSAGVPGNGTYAFLIRHENGRAEFAAKENAQVNRSAELEVGYVDSKIDSRSAPACGGAWWGIYRPDNADLRPYEGTELTDTTMPRKFDAFRRYYSLSEITGESPNQSIDWPLEQDAELARDRVMFLQIETRCFGPCPTHFNGHPLPEPVRLTSPPTQVDAAGEVFDPNDIAAGKLDPLLRAVAQKIKSFPGRLVVDVSSEVDTQVEWMPSAAMRTRWIIGYRNMLRRFHELFAAEGVANVSWNYVVGGFLADDRVYTRSYPGDAYVDWISWDPYDTRCRLGSAFATFHDFYSRLENGLLGAGATRKAYGIMEFGFGEACQAEYLENLAEDLKRLPKIKAVLYFDRQGENYTLTPDGWRAYAKAGQDPYLNQPHA